MSVCECVCVVKEGGWMGLCGCISSSVHMRDVWDVGMHSKYVLSLRKHDCSQPFLNEYLDTSFTSV